MSVICNLSRGIRNDATNSAITGVVINISRKGYTYEQIAEIVEKSIEETEVIIKKKGSCFSIITITE